MLLLKTLFIVVILVLFLVFLLVTGLKSAKGKILKALGAGSMPQRIHLERQTTPRWKDAEAVRTPIRALRGLGFADAGTWKIAEMDFLLQALVKPDDGLIAAVYDRHPVAGSWVDLVTYYADGTSLTYANLAGQPKLDDRPGHDKRRVPGMAADAMAREMLAQRPRKPVRPVQASEFQNRFETAYAEEMDWRAGRGGATEDEIRRVAAASGRAVTDADVKLTREVMERNAKRGQDAG